MEEKNLRFGKNPDKSGRGLSAYIFYRRHKHIQANMQKSQRHHGCLARSLKATKNIEPTSMLRHGSYLVQTTRETKTFLDLKQRCFYP